jgi:cyclophilin family peptidyl-prolyl cis-trans isomerase
MSTTAKWITGIAAIIVIAVLWFFLDHRNEQLVPTGAEIQTESPATTTPAAPAPASSASQAPATPSANQTTPMKNFSHQITIVTSKGTIVFETYDADAPNTVKNFLTLTDKGFYNGTIFHRVIEGFMIQGGDPTGTGRGGPGYQFADELNSSTPSYKAGYVRGTVAMANAGPDTNGSQFFIMQADQALPHNYTIFGKVVSGMDVVDAIAKTPRDASDKPLTPVTMTKVTEVAK